MTQPGRKKTNRPESFFAPGPAGPAFCENENSRMRVSIIVPVHNTAAFLPQCVESLLAQDFPAGDFEILMVDNNSTDGSGQLLRAMSGIRVLSEPKPGSYCARNRGIREARGEVIVFTDSDCFPDRGWLKAACRALEKPSVQVVLGQRRPGRDEGVMRLIAAYEVKKDEVVLSSNDERLYFGFTNNMAVRRSTLDKYGPFVERPRGADTIFVRRVVGAEGCAAVVYDSSMKILHGEMSGVGIYYRKMFIYGRSRRQYQGIVKTRPLSAGERWRIYREAVREERHSAAEALALAVVLACGVVAWHLGAWSHHFSERPVK